MEAFYINYYTCLPLSNDLNQNQNLFECDNSFEKKKLTRDVFPLVIDFQIQDYIHVKYQSEWYPAIVDEILQYFTDQNEPDSNKCVQAKIH